MAPFMVPRIPINPEWMVSHYDDISKRNSAARHRINDNVIDALVFILPCADESFAVT